MHLTRELSFNKKDSKINWNERDNICLKLIDEKYKEIYDRIPYQALILQ